MVDLRVRIGDVAMQNPIMPGSGTFAEGMARSLTSIGLAPSLPRPLPPISARAIRRRASPNSAMQRCSRSASRARDRTISAITPCRSIAALRRR